MGSHLDNILYRNMLARGVWQISVTTGWENDQRLYTTKQEEIAAVMANVKRFLALLKVSKASTAVEAAYIHRKASRVVVVDGYGLAGVDTLIYTFPEDEARTLHLLCLGKADTEHADMEYCKSTIYYIVNQQNL